MKMNDCYLPAEWYEQSMIQLTWPHEGTDWAYMLHEVEECFCRLAHEISSRQHLLIVTPDPKAVQEKLEKQDVSLDNISWACVKTNDTWARDHSFITLLDAQGTPHLLDFCFNGWGMKFPANLDNQINRALRDTDLLHGEYHNRKSFVLEGGSIESDGQGTLLTTAECLFSPNRNDSMNPQEIETSLKDTLGASRVLWLHHGYLAGDDTDSHVDTLARLCPDDTIVYVQCLDKNDEHYEELKLMEKELSDFRTLSGFPYRLLPLPMPDAVYDDEGERLPATYANFLIMNDVVLYPTYQQPAHDVEARRVLGEAFPGREIVGVDCSPLIKQHGSLHCVTMQYPKEVRNI